MIGKKFGKLTVIEDAGRSPRRYILWKCRCECGNETIVTSNNLRSGNTKSCGCVGKAKVKMLNYVTGAYKSRLHRIWDSMKSRCYNENMTYFQRYGGRGVTVCDEWRNNFKAFYDWAMSNGYTDELTIDRIDNNGNYSPENCRWSTMKEQSRNRRTNHQITWNGKTMCISAWANELGINVNTIIARFGRGWDVERTFTTPVKH